MSKGQKNETYDSAKNQQATNNANEAANNTQLQGVLGTAQSNASNELPGIMAGYSDIASTGGGVNATADSTYQNLATTGGLSPESIQAMKDEASQAAQGAYSTAGAQASRTAAATGGYGNTGAIQAQIARQGGDAASTATSNELASIAGMQLQGKEAGASGLATQQQALTGNKLAAIGGQSNVYGMNAQQATSTMSQILQNYQQTGQLNNQDMSIMANIAEQPGMFSQVISGLGSLGGLAGSLMTGISSLRGKK